MLGAGHLTNAFPSGSTEPTSQLISSGRATHQRKGVCVAGKEALMFPKGRADVWSEPQGPLARFSHDGHKAAGGVLPWAPLQRGARSPQGRQRRVGLGPSRGTEWWRLRAGAGPPGTTRDKLQALGQLRPVRSGVLPRTEGRPSEETNLHKQQSASVSAGLIKPTGDSKSHF